MIIDVHTHHVTFPRNTNYLKWLQATGDKTFGPFYLWDHPGFENLDMMLEQRDKSGVTCSVNTYSANITHIIDANSKDGNKSAAVRSLNDSTVQLCQRSGKGFLTTALVDLRLGAEALSDMGRIADQVVGYSVLTAYLVDGKIRFLDDPIFEPFWTEVQQYGKPVFIHFSNLYKINDPSSPLPGYMNDTLLYAGLGQLMEDSVCLARLVLSGVFDRHPELKLVFGQLGGIYPFMLERMEMLYCIYSAGAARSGLDCHDFKSPEHFLRNIRDYTDGIYIDTHSMGAPSIKCAAEILGENKIMYGSDYPITPSAWGMDRALEGLKSLKEPLRSKVLYKNAQSLLGI